MFESKRYISSGHAEFVTRRNDWFEYSIVHCLEGTRGNIYILDKLQGVVNSAGSIVAAQQRARYTPDMDPLTSPMALFVLVSRSIDDCVSMGVCSVSRVLSGYLDNRCTQAGTGHRRRCSSAGQNKMQRAT